MGHYPFSLRLRNLICVAIVFQIFLDPLKHFYLNSQKAFVIATVASRLYLMVNHWHYLQDCAFYYKFSESVFKSDEASVKAVLVID